MCVLARHRCRWTRTAARHRPVQDGWQHETGSRVTLRGRSAPPCAGCCARMHSRCTRLSVQRPGTDGVHTCWSRPVASARGLLPNRLHGRGETSGKGEAGLRFELRGRSAPPCARCRARLRIRRTRLSMPTRRECKVHVRTSELRRVLVATEGHGTVAMHAWTDVGVMGVSEAAQGPRAMRWDAFRF